MKMFAETPSAFLCPNTKRKGLGEMGGKKREEALARQSSGRTDPQAYVWALGWWTGWLGGDPQRLRGRAWDYTNAEFVES